MLIRCEEDVYDDVNVVMIYEERAMLESMSAWNVLGAGHRQRPAGMVFTRVKSVWKRALHKLHVFVVLLTKSARPTQA
jgi:hypothetical protein